MNIKETKDQARALVESLAKFGIRLKHHQALEVLSQVKGAKGWNQFVAGEQGPEQSGLAVEQQALPDDADAEHVSVSVAALLEQAAQCKTEADADQLLQDLTDAFVEAGPLAHLEEANSEAYMEDDGPFVRFELNRVISDSFITMIRPEIRSGELVVVVVTNHMKDGLGMQSKSWDVANGLDEEVIEGRPEQTINELANQAKELAMADHRLLIEQVGVTTAAAAEAVQKSW